MTRLLSWVNLIMGLLLFFVLSEIVGWDWFLTPGSKLIVFILSVLLVGNAVFLAFGSERR